MSNDTSINPVEIKNKWVKVDGVPMSMYQENAQMTERVYWAYKREYSFKLMNVGTPCNTKCFYCSQYWNPPEIIIAYPKWLTFDEIKHFLTFVPEKTITAIGYGHHVSNGEFFAHPNAKEILQHLIDEKYTVRGIDTNGHFVNEEHIKLLSLLMKHRWGRSSQIDYLWSGIYLHLTNYEKTKHTFELLDKHEVPYAVVIVPTLVDLENGKSEEWIRLLNENHNPIEIEISHPAYTKYAPPNVIKHLDFTWDEGWKYIKKWQKLYPRIKIDSENQINTNAIDESLSDLIEWDNYEPNSKMLFLVSESVEKVFESHVKKITSFNDYKIQMVKNTTFGGNIIVAGLLLVQDYIPVIEKVLSEGYKPDVIILPKAGFFFDELDLTGVSAHTIKDKFGIEVCWC
jgi:hypothetical protein